MNKKLHNDNLKIIFIPLLAIFMLIAAITISGNLNSRLFPDGAAGTPHPRADELTAATDGDRQAAATEAAKTTVPTEEAPPVIINAAHVDDPDYVSDHYIVVYLGSQNVIVYGKDDDGGYTEPVKCFSCSTGCEGHTTRTGMYSIIRKYRWRLLVGDVYGQYSTGFSSSYLFHSVPYFEEDASTLDEAEYDKLGSPASHGCVRLCVRDAKWIFENCDYGTQVNIVDDVSESVGEPIPERIDEKKYSGWDPSDPDPESPYNS